MNGFETRGRARKTHELLVGLQRMCTGIAFGGSGCTFPSPFTGGTFDRDDPVHWTRLAAFVREMTTAQWETLAKFCGVNPPSAKTRIAVLDAIADQQKLAEEMADPDFDPFARFANTRTKP